MFGNGLRIGRWFGVPVSIDGSWLVIAFLVSWSFYAFFTTRFPQLDNPEALVLGVATTLLFFASVVLHELSHSLIARRLGIPVEGITLFIFGGVTKTTEEARSPGEEFAVAVVGPLSSIGIAAVFWALVNLTGDLFSAPVLMGLGYLGWLNLALGVFNLLPGFPLDGGRVLRSLVWQRTKDMVRGTRVAVRGVQIVGSLLIALGVLQVLAGALVGGLWFVAIGWFLMQAAVGNVVRKIIDHRLL